MKRIVLSLIVLTSACLVGLAQEKKATNPADAAILKLEQQWEQALTKSDTGALDRLYDETLIYTHSNGKVDTKASFIRAIKSGASQYQSMTRDDVKVTVYGAAAVVTCHWEVHVLSGGNKVDLNARYLHVYVQQPEGWKLVAHESTKMNP